MSKIPLHRIASSFVLLIAAGCAGQSGEREPHGPDKMTGEGRQQLGGRLDSEHEHPRGVHGGVIATLGREEYHAEAVIERDGSIRLYTSGSDATRVLEVDEQELTAYAKPDDGSETAVAVLRPEPLAGDTDGKTSQFVGALPADLSGRSFVVSVPNLRISGERFRARFPFEATGQRPDMPAGVAAMEARELYLTPGGKYTQEDIAANGSTTAAQKYRDFLASHDPDPQPGAPICPVTQTKANPDGTWIIAGETYQFCCPPCIDEFLALAKENPSGIESPETYVKQ